MRSISFEEYKGRFYQYHDDSYEILSYESIDKPVKIIHKTCGNIYSLKQATTACRNNGGQCPECVKNYDYIDRSYPELASHFKNQSETHISKSSTSVVDLICPSCGRTIRSTVVGYVKKGHVPCDLCSDGFSYPEKFIANMLAQMNIEYIHEYSPSWAKPYRYDFMFRFKGNSFIIEADGHIGHGNTETKKRTIEESIAIDLLKDRLAKEHGYIMIRIDCNYLYNRYEHVKNSIIDKLNTLFPLDMVDWNECNLRAMNSKFREVLDIYRTQTKYVDSIAQIARIKPRTVIKYLYEAQENGIIDKEMIWKKKMMQDTPTPVISLSPLHSCNEMIYCYEDALLFKSITDVALYYGTSRASLCSAFRCNNGYYIGRHFIKYKDLPSNFDYKPKIFSEDEYLNSSSKKGYCQYTLSGELVHVYFRKEELPKGFRVANIWRVCSGIRSTAYGYKWKVLSKQDEFEIFSLIKENEMIRQYMCS